MRTQGRDEAKDSMVTRFYDENDGQEEAHGHADNMMKELTLTTYAGMYSMSNQCSHGTIV